MFDKLHVPFKDLSYADYLWMQAQFYVGFVALVLAFLLLLVLADKMRKWIKG